MKKLVSALLAIFLIPSAAFCAATGDASIPTKAVPTTNDKVTIGDASDVNSTTGKLKSKDITLGTLPISTATQSALNGKANASAFASQSAFTAAWGWTPGGISAWSDIQALLTGTGTYVKADGTTGDPSGTITTGTGVAAAMANALDGTGGLASKASLDALPSIVFGTGLTVSEDTPSAGTDTVSITANIYQAYDADLTIYAGITPSANIQSLLGAANYAAMRTLLDLEVGTDFNAFDADLTTWAGVTPGTGVATFIATPSGANLASALTSALPASKGGTGLTAIGTGVGTALGNNTGAVGGLPTIIASGAYTVDTASINANTCASAVAVTASGVATTDIIIATPSAILSSVTGFGVTTAGAVRVDIYPTSGNVNFQFCNPTGAAIDPGSVTFNWKVIR